MNNSRKQVIRYLGQFMMMIGIICLLPLAILIFYPEEVNYAKYFIIPGLGAIVLGFIITILLKNVTQQRLEKHQDAVLVVFIWILTILICSVPFYLTGEYTFTNSVFESISGYSTCGLTIVDVTSCSHIFLFFRSFTQVIGGIGLVLVFTSALSDKHGMRLYSAEGHSDKLMPNLAKSARLILSIYLGYMIVGTILYYIFGMNLFDAINHSMTAVATGGFSTKVNSIGYYNSLGIEIVTWILMILGSTNFVVHTFLIKGKIKKVFHHSEIRFFYSTMIIFVPLMALSLLNKAVSYSEGLRVSMFQFISGITGTGFEIVGTKEVSSTFLTFLMVAMVIGGGIGSTSGGIKQYRVWLFFKSIWWNMKARTNTHKVIRPKYIARYDTDILVTDKEINDNFTFIAAYIIGLLLIALIFTCFGYNLEQCLVESASVIGTVGIGTGITGPTANPMIMWTAIFGMFFGRLEIIVIFLASSRIIKSFKN